MNAKTAILALFVLMTITFGSIAAYDLVPLQTNAVEPCQASYNVGHYTLWAGGSSTDCPFKIARDGTLTGGFKANASLDFVIQTADEFQQRTVGSIPIMYSYSLRSTTGTNLNVTLPAGSYYIEFYFIYSYKGYSAVNGTADYGYTALNITRAFVVNLE